MWEVAGGIIIAVFALMAIGTLARRLSSWLFFRRVQKLRDDIASGALEGDGDLTKGHEERYSATVELVKFKCRYAENYIAEGNEERLQKVIGACLLDAEAIDDDFYRSAALHPIADLLWKAGQAERAKAVAEQIPVDFIREKALAGPGA